MIRPGADRVAALFLLLFAVAYGAHAFTFRVTFVADPLGPRAAPWLLACVLAVSAFALLVRPGAEAAWPDGAARLRIVAALAAVLAYALLLEILGFVLATTLLILGLALPLGGPALAALVAAAAFSTAAYYLFVFALDVPLPIGRIFPFLGG